MISLARRSTLRWLRRVMRIRHCGTDSDASSESCSWLLLMGSP